MKLSLSQDAFVSAAADHNLIPIHTDFTADSLTPLSAYARLAAEGGPSFLLESISGGEHLSRYSFLGSRPRKRIVVFEEETRIVHKDGSIETVETPNDPLELIEADMAQYSILPVADLPPFIGGAVGGLAYEYIHRVENTVPAAKGAGLETPLLYYLITDSVVVFDHAYQQLKIVVNAHVDGDPAAAYDRAISEIEAIIEVLRAPSPLKPLPIPEPEVTVPSAASNVSQASFEAGVLAAKEYIKAGDIFQVVLSQRFEEPFDGSPLDLYRVVRMVNPSPYMFIIQAEDFALVGASPEVHYRLQDDRVTIRPIAGTRPRGKTSEEDRFYERDLLADEKERAEHLMLVDLARNDIGRVCKMGTVSVEDFMVVEHYSHVMHIVSQAEGDLAEGKNAYDVMRATFPAGTVSGAPKIRAMQIIAEYEPERRGFYSGAVGYFSYDGSQDSAIALRTAVVKDGKVYIQAGAGVVADSDPTAEYTECVNKSRALVQSVRLARKML
ncbi:MAG: anthranilate synthase component I [Opitutales bacterium]|nr:anthranilate synthase component I [Opitutales bacterium]NRA27087.1 anthranilate synthase component I [Opitutales bacterium]